MKKIRMVYEKHVAISEQEQEEQEPDPEPMQQEIGVLDPDCPMDQFNYDEIEFCSVADSSDKSWWHYHLRMGFWYRSTIVMARMPC